MKILCIIYKIVYRKISLIENKKCGKENWMRDGQNQKMLKITILDG